MKLRCSTCFPTVPTSEDPGLQPEPEKMEPEEVASMAATVTESDPPQASWHSWPRMRA